MSHNLDDYTSFHVDYLMSKDTITGTTVLQTTHNITHHIGINLPPGYVECLNYT